ncbi:oxygen-regulated protein 1 [Engraulis encrasicolus]|uniref:oxygen-regulated protein 1 n=1 Tax=Engraulis encrasicolus TaxID=184585 RepID=UPI002FD6B529
MTSGMSITPHPDLLHAGVSPGSFHTVSSRPRPRAPSNSLASKRVCFYKSGDPQFGGLRMVVNVRTFKTFDALLDALSKKVPLPFGVRTITTPHGTNSIRALEELQDGGSYVCSDRKRVKPLNLEQANRRQVPWNTTRPISAWRRGNLRTIPRRADVAIRPARIIDRTIAVRTPKRLTVFKNRDPTVKRIVVLQRRIAPTFDALLDYLSQIMQFPVVKLFTPDGRRVEGLAGLILCSGVVVAGGTEHFRLTNFNFQSGGALNPTQAAFTMEQPRAPTQIYQKNSPSSSARSRKFSLSSERYIVNQIKKSLSESLSEHESHHSGSLGTFLNRPTESVDMDPPECTSGLNRRDCPAMPSEDDIEKSFRVNQDGSMTVEMKVRLTLKQEEMVHWTTTLSRTTVSCQYLGSCTLHSVSGPNSPDVSNDSSRNAGGHNAERAPEASHCHTATERTVAFTEQVDHYCSSAKAETSRNLKYSRRTPTPGPRHVKSHSASVENITTVTETAVQESTVGTYSYMEHTAEGDVTEGYCVVSRSSASSIRPVPKPRTMGSAEGKKNTLHPTVRASGVADALQIHNSDVTETVKYVYETQSQGNYENYLASPQHSLQKRPSPGNSPRAQSKQASTDSGPCSSNNDCDVDLTRRSTASESSSGKKDEMFSLSSGSMPPPQQQPKTASESSNGKKDEMSSLSSGSMPPQQQQPKTKTSTSSSRSAAHQSPSVNEDIRSKTESVTKRSVTSTSQKKSSPLSSRSERGQRNTGTTDSDNVAKTRSSAESLQNRKISRVKNSERNNGTPASKSTNSALSAEQSLNLNEGAVGDLSYNLNNSDSEKPKEPYRKNVQDILMSLPPGQTTVPKQKSLSNDRGRSPKRRREISESASMPLLCSTPPVQQYVESWLQQVQPGIVPYMEELYLTEAENGCQTLEGLSTPADNDLSKGSEEIPCDEEASLPAEDLSVDKAEQYPAVQLRCEGELLGDEPQGMRGFCRSMPSVRIHPADQDSKAKLHKSTEALFPLPAESEPPNDVTPNFTGGMKPMVQQLCLSLQSIRRVSSPMLPASLEKTRSLPDFSGQVASAFGASSFKLLSFLSVMTLKDGSDSLGSQISLRSTNSYCPEALKVMQSLEKLATTEDEQELRASLTDLRKSTSPKFQESWREFQEKYDIQDSPLASPKGTEQEFILEVQSETSDQRKEKAFDIEQLMEDLSSVSDELWQELSSLAEGEAIYHDLSVATGDTLPMNAPCSSSLIKARDLKSREDMDVPSTAETKEEDGAGDQINNPALEDNAQDSPPVGECNMYVGSWLEKMQPEPIICVEEVDHAEAEYQDRAVFKIGPDTTEESEDVSASEHLSAEEEGLSTEEHADKQQRRTPFLQVKCEVELPSHKGQSPRGFCRSMPSVRVQLADQDRNEKMHRSTEALFPLQGEPPNDVTPSFTGGMKPIVQQLRLSLQSIRRAVSPILPASLEKARSLPDFSGQVASVFGASSTKLLSFLSVMTLKDGSDSLASSQISLNSTNSYFPEALKVMQSLEKLASTEDEQELRASLTDLRKSTSPKFQESWREFQDKHDIQDSPLASPKGTEQEFALEVQSETGGEKKTEENSSVLEQLMEELSMCEELRQEIASLVGEEVPYQDGTEPSTSTAEEDSHTESEDIDRDRFLTPISEPEHKEIEKGSESFKGDVDTDCQSEQAKCELSEEDIAAVETAVNTDSPVEEEDGHIQEDGCHDELAANFTQAPSSAEEKEASPVSSSLDEGVSSHSGNGVSPSEMEDKSPDSQIDAQIPVLPRKIYSSGEYSQEFLDFVNKALLSSTLAFTYDCDGNLRIQPEICGDGMCIRSRMDAESEYGLKRLPSPCTSDLSDYRPETADSVASRLQYSADSSTGNEEVDTISQRSQHETDEVGEHSHDQGSASSAENRRESSPPGVKSNISPESDVKSVCSLKSNEDPPPIDPHPQDIAHFSTSSSGKGDSESVQYMSFTKTELSEGVLIDKGRWLLKENHLIRTSPPQATEMYGQVDSSSAHSAHSHSSEEGPASQHANHPSAMLVYSSSELEEMAKPPTPKCTYFTIPHSSDSDPFHDDGCSIGSKQGDSMRGTNKVFPQQEPPKTWARKNSSLSSFASVEFKLPDGKIHPEVAPIVERAPRSQAVVERRLQEQEPTESLRLRCGQLHCPIL